MNICLEVKCCPGTEILSRDVFCVQETLGFFELDAGMIQVNYKFSGNVY